MTFILSRMWQGLKVIHKRAVVMGVTMPRNERWKVYIAALSGPALIAIVLANNALDPDPEHWRVYLGWGIVGACLFFTPFILVMLYSHHRRDRIDPALIDPEYRQAFDLHRNFKIGMIAAFTAPPLIRLILRLFGYEF